MKVLIIIPAYNEEKNIGKVIDEIKKELGDFDILVINDASTDNTKKVLQQKKIRHITLPYNMGYSYAIQTGIKYALYNNYDYCLQMDADGQHIATEAKKILNKMEEEEFDIVIGSRFMKETDYRHGILRKCGTKVLSFLIKIICHQNITDPTSGLQCINKRAIERFAKIGNYPEFPDANLIIELLLDGYKIKEVPTQMRAREFGTSMHKGIIKPIKYMIKVIYTIVIIILRNILRRKNK